MTNLLYKAVNITTKEKIAINAYVLPSIPANEFGENGELALVGVSNVKYLKEKGIWKELSSEKYEAYVKHRMLCFVTDNKTTAALARINDLAKENDTYYWLSELPATRVSNWLVHNQEAFNQQVTSAFTDSHQRLNSILWGSSIPLELHLIDKLKMIEKIKSDIRISVTEKGTDPGENFSNYAPSINNFVFAPYAYSVDGGQPLSLSSKPGYFMNTMTGNEPDAVPSETINIDESGGWSTGHTMYYNGDFKATRVFNAVWNDYAEFFEKDLNCIYEVGEVISVNPVTEKFEVSQYPNDSMVVGVVTDNYGSIMGGKYETIEQNLKEFIPVALAGRVKVKTSELVKIGDLLVSDEFGKAKRMDDYSVSFGCILGKVIKVIDDRWAEILVMRA